MNKFCPNCGEHTKHKVKESSNGRTSKMKKGYRKRQKKIEKGYGSFPYEDPAHRARGGKNPTSEKKDLVLTCTECGKSWKPKNALRAARFEIER